MWIYPPRIEKGREQKKREVEIHKSLQKTELYPSGAHIKYIICKFIDFPHKARPWIKREKDFACGSDKNLGSLKYQIYLLRTRWSERARCRWIMKKNAAGLENIGNVLPDWTSSLRSKWVESSYMSRFPTEMLIKSSQSSSQPAMELQLIQ